MTEKNKNREDVEKTLATTIFHKVEKYLSAYYDFRYNIIKLDIEYSQKDKNKFVSVNENSLYIELQKKSINIGMEKLLAILKSGFVPHYNPFVEYFQHLPSWGRRDGDYIGELTKYVSAVQQEDFEYHFRKWLVRAVRCAITPNYFNKQALILVHSQQNSGKSTFCRFLCPSALQEYIAEDISNDKDARILLCKNFLINLDELAVLNRQEINSLKSYFSKTQINERLPYDRKNSIIPRTCSFVGSTNMDEFLNDETGSVRWLCFRINSIDWSYRQRVDIDSVWAQAYSLSKDKSFDAELSHDDIAKNEERNKEFRVVSEEQELISQYFCKPENGENVEFLSSTEVLQHLRGKANCYRMNAMSIGKALSMLGYKRVPVGDRRGYFLAKKENEP
jgi:predicted P-loop ATPase